MFPEFITMGVYGFDEAGFFDAIVEAGVDTFCDLRARRGMRGAKYAFVNSLYLQQKLRHLGIRYFHYKALAPGKAVREIQKRDDKENAVAKRERQTLGTAFVEAYLREHLSGFDAATFVKDLGPQAHKVLLFCVEREPEACHRSLVAGKLVQDLGIQVSHLMPSS